ncbi:hypothetical protein [Amycolatopsis jejuensis]|uniref:hypothetical protein n=1 Tax=Amycolatopsis jejuensis TaxID=330084 RepID=UPI000526D344|nr:hypothetical protein [Amycolatopsis jejuensis]
MPADDARTYNYNEIEACVQALKNRSGIIASNADQFASSVKNALVDWQGETAQRYDGESTKLKNELGDNSVWLDQRGRQFQDLSNQFHDQDKRSSKAF